MGGSSSKVKQDLITRTAAEAMTKSIMRCSAKIAPTQQINIVGSHDVNMQGIKMSQHVKFNAECVNSSKNIAEIQQAVTAALKAAVASNSDAITGALSKSESSVDQRIENEIKASINSESITEMVTNLEASQIINVYGSVKVDLVDIAMDQSVDAMMKASQTLLNNLSVVQDITAAMEGDAKSTQTNPITEIVGKLTEAFGSAVLAWAAIAIVFLIIGGIVMVYLNPFSGLFEDDAVKASVAARIAG